MNDLPVSLPKIATDDAELVVIALETAQTLWENGDYRESLRWLRKAAEAAGDAGADVRAVALARSAADLASAIDVPTSAPPSAQGDGAERAQQPSFPWENSSTDGRSTPKPSDKSRASQYQTLRVAVLPSDDDPTHLAVQVLAVGEVAPAGAREALLVALDPSVDLV